MNNKKIKNTVLTSEIKTKTYEMDTDIIVVMHEFENGTFAVVVSINSELKEYLEFDNKANAGMIFLAKQEHYFNRIIEPYE